MMFIFVCMFQTSELIQMSENLESASTNVAALEKRAAADKVGRGLVIVLFCTMFEIKRWCIFKNI